MSKRWHSFALISGGRSAVGQRDGWIGVGRLGEVVGLLLCCIAISMLRRPFGPDEHVTSDDLTCSPASEAIQLNIHNGRGVVIGMTSNRFISTRLQTTLG